MHKGYRYFKCKNVGTCTNFSLNDWSIRYWAGSCKSYLHGRILKQNHYVNYVVWVKKNEFGGAEIAKQRKSINCFCKKRKRNAFQKQEVCWVINVGTWIKGVNDLSFFFFWFQRFVNEKFCGVLTSIKKKVFFSLSFFFSFFFFFYKSFSK